MMNGRLAVIAALALAVLFGPVAAEAQPALAAWRRALREEADALLERLGRHLAQPDA